MRKLFLLCAALVCPGSVPWAGAETLLFEPFNYADGPLVVSASASPWSTHSGIAGQAQVLGGRLFLSQTNSEDVSVAIPGQPYGADSSDPIYLRFRIQFTGLPAGAGNYFAHLKDTGSGFRSKFFATTNGAVHGSFRLGVANSANVPGTVAAMDLELDRAYVVVARYVPGNSTTRFWIDPAAETDPAAEASDPATAVNITAFAWRQSLSSGDGMGTLFVDDLAIGTAFEDVAPSLSPQFTKTPEDQVAFAGTEVLFAASASGSPPLTYQWFQNGEAVAHATNALLLLPAVTTGQAGLYEVRVANPFGTNSATALLTVKPLQPRPGTAVSVLTYNVNGNGVADWSTNNTQVRAIGRQLAYLTPDIIAFNEIPHTQVWQMTNFVAAFLPGYNLATNSGTDGYIRSVVASRFPILSSQKWLDGVSLAAFGYSGNFTRDLFQARIAVPEFPQPLNVFVTHLKATTGSDAQTRQEAADKRAAECSAISNFFAITYLTGSNRLEPYILAGDLNEDFFRPDSSRYISREPIQRLVSPPTGLQLTTPVNPATGEDFTLSIQATLNVRFDYVLPCGLLFSNVVGSQVFRSDMAENLPESLLSSDSVTASDHLPVMVFFGNPYTKAFRLLSLVRTGAEAALEWESVPGQTYRLERSDDAATWSLWADGLMATGTTFRFVTNSSSSAEMFRVSR